MLSLFISCEEDKNPAGPSGYSYNDSLYFDQDTLTTFINDTIVQEVKCNSIESCSKFIWLENSKSDTTSSNFFKKSWDKPGQKHISVWAIKKNGVEIKQATFEVIVNLGKPSLKVDSIKTCYVKDTLLINATSSDSNGTVVKYLWSYGNQNDTTTVPNHKYAWSDSGKKVVDIRCIDDDGIESDIGSCIVHVKKGNPMVIPLKDTTCFINDTILLCAHASDENGQIKSFFWSSGDNDYTLGDSLFKYSWKTPGQKTIYVKAVDDDSVQSIADTCLVIVREGKPVVHLAQVKNHVVRDTVTFSATHNDTNGIVEKYVWQYTAGGIIKTDTVSPGQYKIVWPDTGEKRVTLKAIDDDGIFSSPDTCYLSVTYGAIPVVRLMNDTTIYIRDTLVVTATGTDSDGTISRYYWSVNSTAFGNSTIAGLYPLIWSDSGKYVVYGQAKDNDGQLSNIDSCIVTVKTGLPLCIAVSDTTVSVSCNSSISRVLRVRDENLGGSGITWYLDTGTTAGWDYSSKDSVITFSKPGGGVLNIVWAACDDDLNFTKKDTFTITFNRPPTCSLISPRDTANWLIAPISSGKGNVIFRWNGSDPDGSADITSYNFYLGKSVDNLQLQYSGLLTSDTLSNIDTMMLYYWKVTVKDLFKDSAVVLGTFITPYGPPVINAEPRDTVVFKGDTAYFSVNATGHDLHYTWMKNTAVIDTINSMITIASAQYSDKDTTYRCIVSNKAGADTSRFTKLSVKPHTPVTDSTTPSDTTVTQRVQVKFRVSAAGDSLKYQWQRNGINLTTGSYDSVYVLDTAKLADNGSFYRCIISNSSGADTSRGSLLLVKLAAPVIISNPNDTAVTEGNRVQLKILLSGDSLVYQWQKDSIDISGKNSDSLVITSVSSTDAGGYRCIVSNNVGIVKSTEAKLKIIPRYTLVTSMLPAEGGTVMLSPSGGIYDSGTIVTMTATCASGYDFSSWGGSATGTNTSLAVTMNGNKSVTANFVVHVLPTFTLTTTVLPSIGGSISLSPSGGTYDSGTVVTLTASKASGYDFTGWSGSATGTSTTVTVTMTGNKSVTSNFSVHVSKFTLSTSVLPSASGSVTLSPSGGTYDSGTVVTLTASPASGYSFSSWSGSATGTSSSTNVTMTGNKSVTANFILNIAAPVITSQPIDRTITEGNTVTFSITATGSNLSYQWKRNGTSVGTNSDSYSYSATNSRCGDEVYCIVSNSAGSVTSSSAYLIVNDSKEFDSNPLYASSITANGSSQSHTLTEDDEDWMKFYAIAGNVYTIETTGDIDTYLELYNSSTAVTPSLSDDDSGSDYNAQIVLPCLGTGYFWIRVLSEVGDIGHYSISVTSP